MRSLIPAHSRFGLTVPRLPKSIITRWLPGGLIIAVVVYYFGFLYRHNINVPFADDIYDILAVLSQVILAEDKMSAFQILYAQHNDHRTLSSRLLYGLVYSISGKIDFRQLTFLAHLALPLLLLSLYLMAQRQQQRLLILLPAALILFQLRAYGITLWAMAAFAYFYVFLYGFYSLYFISEVTPAKFILAVILASLATFTLASGQVIWLVGLASLLHQRVVCRSGSYLYPTIWLVIGFTVLVAWRVGLETPNSLSAMLEVFFNDPGHHILYTLTLLGSAVSSASVAGAAMAGFAMLVMLIASTVLSFQQKDLRLEFCCWFVVLSVMAMVFGRSFTSVDYALSSRYSFPSVLMVAVTWVLVASRLNIQSGRAFLLITMLTGLHVIASHSMYAKALQIQLDKRVSVFNNGNYWSWSIPIAESNGAVEQAITLGIYTPPPRPLAAAEIDTR